MTSYFLLHILFILYFRFWNELYIFQEFKSREASHAAKIKQLRLPYAEAGTAAAAAQGHKIPSKVLHDDSDIGSADDNSSIDGDNDDIEAVKSESKSSKRGNNSSAAASNKNKKFRAGESKADVTCGYCLETGHEDFECPYDENNK